MCRVSVFPPLPILLNPPDFSFPIPLPPHKLPVCPVWDRGLNCACVEQVVRSLYRAA